MPERAPARLVRRVWHQRHLSRALDGVGDLPLVLPTGSCLARLADPASLVQVLADHPDMLVVDDERAPLCAEIADPLSLPARTALPRHAWPRTTSIGTLSRQSPSPRFRVTQPVNRCSIHKPTTRVNRQERGARAAQAEEAQPMPKAERATCFPGAVARSVRQREGYWYGDTRLLANSNPCSHGFAGSRSVTCVTRDAQGGHSAQTERKSTVDR